MKIGIIGNPNVGKTTVFNYLTGLNQKVSNWPGVTVEKKVGTFSFSDKDFMIVDLPGIYDFDDSIESRIAFEALLKDVDSVLYIGDSTKIARSLYLLLHIMEIGKPVAMILNYKDIALKQGIDINLKKMEDVLNIPIIQVNARDRKEIDLIKEFVYNSFTLNNVSYKQNIIFSHLSNYLNKTKIDFDFPKFYVVFGLKNVELGEISDKLKEYIESIRLNISKDSKDSFQFISETVYSIAYGMEREFLKRHLPVEEKVDISNKLDRIITNKYLGLPIFAFIMYSIFYLIFEIGNPISDILKNFFEYIKELIYGIHMNPIIISFITNGIINGVGSVLALLPNIVLMFFFMSILEDTGYLARAAFVMDSFMHRFKLHGKSFIPMFLGLGCNVPAIMGARIIESRVDRLITILITPFMSCSARLPVYILFTSIFFKKNQGLVVFSLYFLGIIVAIISANIFRKMFKFEERLDLIMELPIYQAPQLRKLLYHMWERALIYIKKASAIIFLSSLFIWFLSSIPFGVEYASKDAWISKIGEFLSFVFTPAGFGFWQAAVSLIFGIFAKETVVSSMTGFFGGIEKINHVLPLFFSPLSAYAFLVMTLLYIPCIATISVIRSEAGTKWAVFSVLYTLFVGWIFAVAIYQIGSIFS